MAANVINPLERRPDPALLERLAAFPTAFISDGLGRGVGAVGLHRYGGGRMIGPAFTVKTRPGDNLMIHKALDMAAPGDILVVDGAGDLSCALFGDLLTAYAVSRGIGGLVVDGAVRDLQEFAEGAFPCFARGCNMRGPTREGPGQINVPVVVGGMIVNPGDVVMGDADGVIAFSPARAAEVLAGAQTKVAKEQGDFAAIAAGTWDRGWVDKALGG